MSIQLRREYNRFRQAGFSANHAFSAAKTELEWELYEQAGLVKLDAEPEEDNYFSCHGLWCVVGRFFSAGCWQLGDAVGMCAGYSNVLSPFENNYVPDIKRATLDALQAYLD